MSESFSNATLPHEVTGHRVTDVAKWENAPLADWADMSATDHFVQFYEADGFLLNSLSGFIGRAIKSGDGSVVVATKAHREGLDELLLANGVDVVSAKASGYYVALDAADTLAQFMVDGVPVPERFNEVIGSVIARVGHGRPCTRVFGEMVGILWLQGNQSGAIRLEQLWNELQKIHSFALFCAYPMSGFGGEKFIGPYSQVCGAHSRVIPAESYASLPDVDARLRTIALLQQKAKSLEIEVNERRQVEERLRLSLANEQIARTEAETASRLKDEFLATVSHEIRTPLNAIIGWSYLLRGGSLDDATKARAMDTIDRNAKAQAQLIEDILDVSRVITGKLTLRNEPVDIASVVNAAIDSVQLAIDSKNLHLEVTLDPSARHTIGDAGRLQQVVWNLLSNAIKFTPSGGRIEIKVKRAAGNMQLRVGDSGQGINPDFLPFIFDRFRQADGTTTRSHGGLGLGLAIVRHLIELHGGSIKADSAGLNQGAAFTVTLPLAPKSTSRRRKVTGTLRAEDVSNGHFSSLPSLDAVKVLLVDDDPDTLQIVAAMLGGSKAVVQTAASVSEALEVIQWYQPHVLISDLAMPGEDGYSLIRKVRNMDVVNGHAIPAIALTSYVRVEDRTRALAAGFNMFVPKPVQPEELLNAIENLVEACATAA